MSTKSKKKQPQQKHNGQEHNGYKIQVSSCGKITTVLVHPPRSIWTKLITEDIRSELVNQAYRIVGDRAIAEDIVQSSFINAYCKFNNGELYAVKYTTGYLLIAGGEDRSCSAGKFLYPLLQKARKTADEHMVEKWLRGEEKNGIEFIEKPFAWMHTIVERNAYKFYSKQKRWQAFATNSANWSLVEDSRYPNPEQTILRAEKNLEIRRLVSALPPHYRDIIILRYFQGEMCSFKAIAEKLHRPLSTVTSQSKRAHKMLREALDEKIDKKRIVKNGKLVRQKKLG